MPYLAFDLDAFANCANIAQGCGLRPADVSHGLLSLWRHCWIEKTDRVTTGHLKAFFVGADVAEMLMTFGHLEASEKGWRVKGARKYLRVSEAQSEAGKTHAGNLQRGRKDLEKAEKEEKADLEKGGVSPGGLRLPSGSPSGSSPALSSSIQHPASNIEKETTAFLEREVFDHWVKTGKRNANTTLTDVRRLKVRARLREGYSVEQLKRAVDGCAVTPHNQGETDGQIHDDLELICRSAGHVDRFIRNADSPPRPKQRSLMADPNQDFPTGILNAPTL